MRDNERTVGRADHNRAGAEAAMQGADDPSKTMSESLADDSADVRAHGTHGRGRGEEKRDDQPPPQPDKTAGSDRGGSAGWGNAASGGSVVDKRTSTK
jgi:hypothetical protein